MLRMFLTVFLAVAHLLAPGLCCCWVAPPEESSQARQGVRCEQSPGRAPVSCCPRAVVDERCEYPENTDERKPCPCRKTRPTASYAAIPLPEASGSAQPFNPRIDFSLACPIVALSSRQTDGTAFLDRCLFSVHRDGKGILRHGPRPTVLAQPIELLRTSKCADFHANQPTFSGRSIASALRCSAGQSSTKFSTHNRSGVGM